MDGCSSWIDFYSTGQVCKLEKALYGLTSHQEWFAKLSSFLLSAGYTKSMNNNSFFINSFE